MSDFTRCSDCGVGCQIGEAVLCYHHRWMRTPQGLVCEGCRPDYDPAQRLKSLHDSVDDLVGKLMYYDRKEDESLPRGAIEKLIEDGHTSLEDIAARFREKLLEP